MRLYRSVSPAEWADIQAVGRLRPAPPSNQGKWFAESPRHAATWGRLFYRQARSPFHVIEVEVPGRVADLWFRLPFLDRIGPARFAEIADLSAITVIGELPIILTGIP